MSPAACPLNFETRYRLLRKPENRWNFWGLRVKFHYLKNNNPLLQLVASYLEHLQHSLPQIKIDVKKPADWRALVLWRTRAVKPECGRGRVTIRQPS